MKKILFLVLLLTLSTCKKDSEIIEPEPTCTLDMANFDYSFGIDYSNPEIYLTPGEQSDLADNYLEEIRSDIGTPELNIAGIKTVCNWFQQNFTFSNAGGAMIGQKTVDELYEEKTHYGCHSSALLLSSILREFGFPTVMIETASIDWANKYNAGTAQGFGGHVMTEVYVSDKWMLLNDDCFIVQEYDYMNPYISMRYPDPLFVYAKGVDTWDYGVKSESDTHEKMINFAEEITCFEDWFGSVNYEWSN